MGQAAKAKAWYIEDYENWRHNVEEFLEENEGAQYFDFETFPTFDRTFENRLKNLTSPLILIIDIRINEDMLAGYTWLSKKIADFIKKNPATVIVVLSGELTDEISNNLKRLGIPEKLIFRKSDWAETRGAFLAFLKETAVMMNNRPSTKKFDSYLSNQVWNECEKASAVNSKEVKARPEVFQILIKLKDSEWNASEVPDLRVLGKIGRIFSGEGTIKTLDYLKKDANVESVEASRSAARPEYEKSMECLNAPTVHQDIGELGDSVIIGIIDVEIDVLNEAFRDESGKESRILFVWDQRDSTGPPPKIKDVTPRGTEHTRQNINDYIKKKEVPPSLRNTEDEEHGTHVASIAAGRRLGGSHIGVAPHAKIIVVILPNDSQVDSYSTSVVAAFQYLAEKAKEENLPIVINISQGLNSGGHDGTSYLEEAVDLLTNNGNEEGIVVVKSAGNERNKQTHALVEINDELPVRLRWSFDLSDGAAHFRKNFVELWFDANDTLIFALQGPSSRSWSNEVGLLNSPASGVFKGGHEYKLSYRSHQDENGSASLLIETKSLPEAGNEVFIWKLRIKRVNVGKSKIHAWIERTECERARFLDHVSEDVTLTIPGTSRHIISVGASDPVDPENCPPYSSRGPTRDNREKPDVSAPGEGVFGITCTGEYKAVRGTSMAAPHVSGAIALVLSFWTKKRNEKNWKQLTSSRIKDALIKSTRHENWDHGSGYGVPDLSKLLDEICS